MTVSIHLEASTRQVLGKGASRRLRRLDNKIPAIIYGGDKAPLMIELLHNKVTKALESEHIYSSVFPLQVDGKAEHVILKAIQRHPYKPVVMHMDFQRVSPKDVLVRMVPLHFIGDSEAKGIKEGGIINHAMTQVEIRCAAKDLPEFIEVDVHALEMNQVLHMTDLKLPQGVQFAIDPRDGAHDHPVVSIHASKAEISDLAQADTAVTEADAASSEEHANAGHKSNEADHPSAE